MRQKEFSAKFSLKNLISFKIKFPKTPCPLYHPSRQVRAPRGSVTEEAAAGHGPQRVSHPATTTTAAATEFASPAAAVVVGQSLPPRAEAGAVRVHGGACAALLRVPPDAAAAPAHVEQ